MLGLLLSPAGRAAGAVLAVLAAGGAGYVKGRLDGRALAEAAIIERLDQENENAGDEAEDWRDALRRCVDGGGLFDFADGTCQH